MRSAKGPSRSRLPEVAGSPRLTPEEVRQLLSDLYGLAVAELEELGGEVDQNIRVRAADGSQYLLKASSGDIDDGLRWQEKILTHLAAAPAGIPVPRLVASLGGGALVSYRRSSHPFVVRLLTWLPGRPIAEVEQPPEYLLSELGSVAARLTEALADVDAEYDRSHHWDIRNADAAVREALPFVQDQRNVAAVRRIMGWFDQAKEVLASLPSAVVHQDLNDFNVLVQRGPDGCLAISGVIDVADALFTVRAAEVAIAAGYAMLRKDDPLWAACAVVKGFHAVEPLSELELRVIFPLAAARLCVNATVWTQRTTQEENPYGRTRMRDTWPAIRKVAQIPPSLAETALRAACGMESPRLLSESRIASLLPTPPPGPLIEAARATEVTLAPGGSLFDEVQWNDPSAVSAAIHGVLGDRLDALGFVRHLSPSLLWSAQRAVAPAEPATLQLGCALLTRVGATVRLPLPGRVVDAHGDGTLVVEHTLGPSDDPVRFWTCWRGVSQVGQRGTLLAAGDRLGTVQAPRNDLGLGAVVHVHVVAAEDVALARPPIRIRPSERQQWEVLTADPAGLLGLAIHGLDEPGLNRDEVVALRDLRLARSQRAYYRRPPNFVRGRGVWLYDDNGFAYLDAINNVTHVGHANPRVTAAAAAQLRKLNTNSRFLYEGIATYAQRLVSTLPAPLEVVFLVCTGSEANDLALRMARQVTGRTDVIVIDGAYHGNTAAVMGISPNRYKGPGGRGAPSTTHEAIRPDVYRGPFGRDDSDAGHKYAADVDAVVQRLVAEGRPPAAFIAESLMGTAGNIVFPPGYLPVAFDSVRRAGGLCISDEVQVGFGRLGSHFWGFEVQGVIPDIVTMGKPIGNGHPIAAVVTTREIADAFDDGVKYFNTFGGNPVSCAVGTTVLDIIHDEGLQAAALETGAYFLNSLRGLEGRHELIGDVRGQGLYLGIELVRDRETKTPAPREALVLSERMKDAGVIVYPTGAHENVLKIKPPMVFDAAHADIFIQELDRLLADDPMMKRGQAGRNSTGSGVTIP